MIIVSCFALSALCLLSCNGAGNKESSTSKQDDSTQIRRVLRDMYKWHADHASALGFESIIKDTLDVGLDTTQLSKFVDTMGKSDLFSSNFLQNYRQIVARTDYKLQHGRGKYLNEINFGFEDSDPWTFFQDDVGNYWDSLILSDLKISADSASLKWRLRNMAASEGYKVKLHRIDESWKISYLQGFDTTCCFW